MPKQVTQFNGAFKFLSNFYPAEVELEGEIYPSVEHAYQAAKTLDTFWRSAIKACPTAGHAKRLGKRAKLRSGWDTYRLEVMRDLLEKKFRDPFLRHQLLSTENADLIEGNYWRDFYWGLCEGQGQNHLGKMLMELRERLKDRQ